MTLQQKLFSIPLLIRTYLLFSKINGPLFHYLINKRKAQSKEHPTRYIERFGRYTKERPKGRLIWFNAASVGEALALRPLIENLVDGSNDVHVLVTTITVTSAEVLEKSLPERAIHQFSPVDTKQSTQAFLTYWEPDFAIWCESELWPRMVHQTKRHGIPMCLINGRISLKTERIWRRFPKTAHWMLSAFDYIFAQSADFKNVLTDLGLDPGTIVIAGSTKESRSALPYDAELQSKLDGAIANRPRWVAGSTHLGEEEIILSTHNTILQTVARDCLLILAPRHPARASKIAKMATDLGLSVSQRSRGDEITTQTQVYLADTIGEMGLWLSLSDIVFVGGSLVDVGGHNPYEPIAMGAAVITGPQFYNFQDIYDRLMANAGCMVATDSVTLSQSIRTLMQSDTRRTQIKRAKDTVEHTNSAAQLILAHISAKLGL